MKNLFHFILLLTFLHGFSQNSEDRNVFKTIIEFEKDSSFVYCEKSEGYLSLLKTISNKKLYNPFISSNKLILSLKEIKFLKTK